MDFGVCAASHINDIDHVVKAEQLGYTHAWLADSQMMWSDCYATLAVAATRTSRINLGTGVAIVGTRPAPVTAASIATINALAPGRTFLGVGAGNTAMRVMGLPPVRIKAFDEYLSTLRPLMRGEEADLPTEKGPIPIRHIMPDKGFVNFEDDIPLYVSGFGPRSLGLAGKHGHGAVIAMPANPTVLERLWEMIEAGAEASGRQIDRASYYTTALTTVVILEPGEAVDSPRVKAECGAMAMAGVHYSYEQVRNFGREPSGPLRYIWDDYKAMIEAYPADRRHQRIHSGHNCWVPPEEERFLTPEVLQASSLIGTRDAVIERLAAVDAAGLDQIMILPNFDTRFQVMDRVAKDVMPAFS